jgi:hypothetical protein
MTTEPLSPEKVTYELIHSTTLVIVVQSVQPYCQSHSIQINHGLTSKLELNFLEISSMPILVRIISV